MRKPPEDRAADIVDRMRSMSLLRADPDKLAFARRMIAEEIRQDRMLQAWGFDLGGKGEPTSSRTGSDPSLRASPPRLSPAELDQRCASCGGSRYVCVHGMCPGVGACAIPCPRCSKGEA